MTTRQTGAPFPHTVDECPVFRSHRLYIGRTAADWPCWFGCVMPETTSSEIISDPLQMYRAWCLDSSSGTRFEVPGGVLAVVKEDPNLTRLFYRHYQNLENITDMTATQRTLRYVHILVEIERQNINVRSHIGSTHFGTVAPFIPWADYHVPQMAPETSDGSGGTAKEMKRKRSAEDGSSRPSKSTKKQRMDDGHTAAKKSLHMGRASQQQDQPPNEYGRTLVAGAAQKEKNTNKRSQLLMEKDTVVAPDTLPATPEQPFEQVLSKFLEDLKTFKSDYEPRLSHKFAEVLTSIIKHFDLTKQKSLVTLLSVGRVALRNLRGEIAFAESLLEKQESIMQAVEDHPLPGTVGYGTEVAHSMNHSYVQDACALQESLTKAIEWIGRELVRKQ